jgi:hypothetical protein
MESKHISVPEQKNYEQAGLLAYKLAREKLAGITDIEEQCRRSGARHQVVDSQNTITLPYLNQSYQITFPDGDISFLDGAGEVPTRDGLLILHYFNSAKGTPASGKLIAFKELPEGGVYSPTFSNRTINPLVKNFGEEPARLLEVGRKLGGYAADYGDTAVTIDAFSRVSITIVLWQGDDEFAAEGNILFDATVSDYLATEDVTVLCEIITWRLIRFLAEA